MSFIANKSQRSSHSVSSVKLQRECVLPKDTGWGNKKYGLWILGPIPFSLLPGSDSGPNLISFKLPRPLVWCPMIFVQSPISCKQSFHGFISLSHIKKHLRKTYHCVLRRDGSVFLLTRGLKTSQWYLGTASQCLWILVLSLAVIVAYFPLQPLTPSQDDFFWSIWHLSAHSKGWLCWRRPEVLG